MTLRTSNRLMVVGLVALAALLLVAVLPGAPQAVAAPAQQTLSCKWASIGNSSSSIFHSAIAMDTDAAKAYIYGGVDTDFAAVNKVEAANLSAANATSAAVSAGGARQMVGAAAAYRAKGEAADGSAVYFIGGQPDTATGSGSNELQRFVTKTNTWERITSVTGTLTDRLFAMAAYDKDHDVIWVVGGINKCLLADVLAAKPCSSSALTTQYLTFDATTGEPKEWKTLSGGNQNFYAAAAAYDPVGKRIIFAGGTTNIQNARNTVLQLSLTDPDPANAKFSTLATSGTAPSAYFLGGAYDEGHNWFVTYGGTRANFMQSNESVNNDTYALDLAATPPTWTKLSTTGTPGDRVAGGLVYDAKNTRVVQLLGRQKYSVATPPKASVQRSIYALTCMIVTAAPPTATKPSSGGGDPKQCPGLERVVPPPVIADAIANNTKIGGWGQLCSPSQPPSPWNIMRTWLGLHAPGKPYHPLYNSVEYKCGCR